MLASSSLGAETLQGHQVLALEEHVDLLEGGSGLGLSPPAVLQELVDLWRTGGGPGQQRLKQHYIMYTIIIMK